jgi:hypothetical protein
MGKANEGELDPLMIGSCLLGNTDDVRECGVKEVEIRPREVGVDLHVRRVRFK